MNDPHPGPASKQEAREWIRATRAALTPEWIREASAAICKRLLELPQLRDARRIGAVQAMPHEPQTGPLLAQWHAEGRELCVPSWDASHRRYRFCRWAPDRAMRSGQLGIAEPAAPEPVETASLDAILVPCVAFDDELRRLGHGKGHYDRLLAGYKGRKIGVAFAFQRFARLPAEPHDVPFDLVVTESAVHRRSRHE